MTYVVSQSLASTSDALVLNTVNGYALSAAITGTDSGATLIIEGSTDGTNWTTLNTITTAGTYSVAYGLNTLVRARLSVAGSASFLVKLSLSLVAPSVAIQGQVSDVSVTPTVTAGAYTAGNEVGGLLHFSNVFGAAFSGTLTDILVTSKSVQTTGYVLYLFSQNPSHTTWTDKSAPSINAADLPYLLGAYTLGAANSGLGTETTNQSNNVNSAIFSVNQDLYGVLTAVATPTYTSTSDVTVSLRVKQN